MNRDESLISRVATLIEEIPSLPAYGFNGTSPSLINQAKIAFSLNQFKDGFTVPHIDFHQPSTL